MPCRAPLSNQSRQAQGGVPAWSSPTGPPAPRWTETRSHPSAPCWRGQSPHRRTSISRWHPRHPVFHRAGRVRRSQCVRYPGAWPRAERGYQASQHAGLRPNPESQYARPMPAPGHPPRQTLRRLRAVCVVTALAWPDSSGAPCAPANPAAGTDSATTASFLPSVILPSTGFAGLMPSLAGRLFEEQPVGASPSSAACAFRAVTWVLMTARTWLASASSLSNRRSLSMPPRTLRSQATSPRRRRSLPSCAPATRQPRVAAPGLCRVRACLVSTPPGCLANLAPTERTRCTAGSRQGSLRQCRRSWRSRV